MCNAIMNLPVPEKILSISQRIALFDAVLSPEWEFRYYSFNSNWSQNQKMASMRDGSGVEYFILFENENCGVKVYNKHKNKTCEKYISENINSDSGFIKEFLNEPAFSIEYTSYLAFWNPKNNTWFECGDYDIELLGIFINPVDSYRKYAESYFEKTIDPFLLEKLFTDERIYREELLKLNGEIDFDNLMDEINEIGIEINNPL